MDQEQSNGQPNTPAEPVQQIFTADQGGGAPKPPIAKIAASFIVGAALIAIGVLAYKNFTVKEQAAPVNAEKKESALAEVYFKYQSAASIDELKQYRYVDPSAEDKLAGLSESDREQAMTFVAAFRPQKPEIASEIIEGDRGALAVQGVGNPGTVTYDERYMQEGYRKADNKPIESRQYQLVLFKKADDGEWKIFKDMSWSYNDPRPQTVKIGETKPFEGDVQRHCGFVESENSCSVMDPAVMQPNDCYECFAKLQRRPSLCDRKASDLEAQDPEFWKDFIASSRNGCRQSVASLVGDPSVCAAMPEKNSFGTNEKDLCLRSIEEHDFLSGANIYALDSDRDGLSDMLEIRYFNTSAANRDTDGDGSSDKAEVDAMTNPLGQGRLGDHLK